MDSTRRTRTHKADVMVSSTVADLPDHRKSAVDSIWRRYMYPLAMEAHAAASTDALTFSWELVDQAEVYIGIFGFRYGYIPDDPRNPDKLSVTELEYRRAKARGIPILCFVVGDDHTFTAKDIASVHDHDPEKIAKRERLKNEIMKDYVVGFFNSPADLGAKIYQSLTELLEKGVIKSDEPDPTAKAEPDRLIAPPEPYIAHRYILTRQFFGRKHELAALDKWAKAPEKTTMIVEAIGGQGKSALTWEWFNHHAGEYDAALWWSFYESESSVLAFVQHALAYLSGKPLKEIDPRKLDENAQALERELSTRRVLLALDGIERVLVAYHRIDAHRRADETAETEAPETAPEKQGDDLRKCTDPRHGDLFRMLAACDKAKLLITTRLIPADLQDKSKRLMRGVERLRLAGLSDTDAYDLITHLGIVGDSETITAYLKQFGNHSLLIGALAGRINEYRAAPGNFILWLGDEGRSLRLHDLDMVQKRSHILHYALAGLKPELRTLLQQIAHFREAVDYETMSAFNPYVPDVPDQDRVEHLERRYAEANLDITKEYYRKKLEEAQRAYLEQHIRWEAYQAEITNTPSAHGTEKYRFHDALNELEGRGLLQWDRIANRYDLHPVVRQYAYEDAGIEVRKRTYARIRDHFGGLPPENLEEVTELNQLNRSITIYLALIGAGLFDQATEFYRDRLKEVLIYHIGAYSAVVELLTPLFRDGTNQPPVLSTYEAQGGRMTDLANAYYLLGEREKEKVLKCASIKLYLSHENATHLSVALNNYSSTLRAENALAASLHTRILSRDLAEVADDNEGLANAYLRLLGAYRDIGWWAEAEAILTVIIANPPKNQSSYFLAEAEKTAAETLIMRRMNAEGVLSRSERLAVESRHHLMTMQIQGLRGEAALVDGNYREGELHFKECWMRARQSGLLEDSSIAIGGVARVRALLGERDAALDLLEQGADDLSKAEVYLTLGDHAQACAWGLKAYEWAWADGEPYVFRWQLERAAAVLHAVGAPLPVLPLMTKSGTGKLFMEDEIRALIEKKKAKKS